MKAYFCLLIATFLLLAPIGAAGQGIQGSCFGVHYRSPVDGSYDIKIDDLSKYPDFVCVDPSMYQAGADGAGGGEGAVDHDGDNGGDGTDGASINIIARTVMLSGRFDLRGGNGGNGGNGGTASWKPGEGYCGTVGRPGNGGNGGKGGRGGSVTIICETLLWSNFSFDVSGGSAGSGGDGAMLEGNCFCPGAGGNGGNGAEGGSTGRFRVFACNITEIDPANPPGAAADCLHAGDIPKGGVVNSCAGDGGNGGVGARIYFGSANGRGRPGEGGSSGAPGVRYTLSSLNGAPIDPDTCEAKNGEPGAGGRSFGLNCAPEELFATWGGRIPSTEPVEESRIFKSPYCGPFPVSFATATAAVTRSAATFEIPVRLERVSCAPVSLLFSTDAPTKELIAFGDTDIYESGDTLDGWTNGVGDGEISAVFNSERNSQVLHFTRGGRFDKGPWGGEGWKNPGNRVIFWMKCDGKVFAFNFGITTSKGNRMFEVSAADGPDTFDAAGGVLHYHLGAKYRDGRWHPVQVDLQTVTKKLSGEDYLVMRHFFLWTDDGYLDEVRMLGAQSLHFEPGVQQRPITLWMQPGEPIKPRAGLSAKFTLEKPEGAVIGTQDTVTVTAPAVK